MGLDIGKQYFSLIAEGTSIASTDGLNSRAVTSNYHKGAHIVINRESETGTATLNAVVQFKNELTGTWQDLEGTEFVEFADGTSANTARYLIIYPGLTGSDADAKLALDTNKGHHSGAYLPRVWRLSLTTTGTTNVVSAAVTLLP